MTFFYDLNKKLDSIRAKPELTHGQLNEGKKAKPDFLDLNKNGNKKEPMKDAAADKKAGPKKGVNPFVKKESVEEAAKWRDPKFKDKLYTQEPRDYDQYDYGDDDYYNPKPDDYPGEKNLKGGGEFSHNDPLQKGQGIGRSGIKHSILDRGPRKGLPSRNQITSLKGSIKDAHGTHARPNLPEAVADSVRKESTEKNTLQKLLTEHSSEVKMFIRGAELNDNLYSDLYDHWRNQMPPGIAKATTGDPMTWISHKLAGVLSESWAEFGVDENDVSPKFTFADKIAGAKKEVDEMLGDVAAEAMRGALSGGQKKLDKNKNGKLDANDFAMLRKGGKKEMGEEEDLNPFTNYKKPRKDNPRIGDVEHGSKHDIKHTSTGRVVTRRTDPNTGNSVGADDDTPAAGEKRGAGRPKGTGGPRQERVTAKSRKTDRTAHGQDGFAKAKKKKVKEDDLVHGRDRGEYDREGEMAQQDLRTAADAAMELRNILDSDENLPEWVQAKITKAMDYLDTSRDYIKSKDVDEAEMDPKAIARFNEPTRKYYTKNPHFTRGAEVKSVGKTVDASGKPVSALATRVTPTNKPDPIVKKSATSFKEEELDEKASSKKQQKFMGMVHAAQKGEKPASKEVGKVARTMKKGDAEDFAATKHKGLPEKKAKKKEESVEENTVSGAVATSSAPAKDSGAPKASKGTGGMVFGKGVYEAKMSESFDSKLKTVLTEGVSMTVSVGEDGNQNLSVNATNEDAVKLAEILRLAGMGQSDGYQEACASCGQSPCGCDHVEEDLANSPDPVYADTDYMVNGLSDGLNGRKTTGQTVNAPYNRQDSRQGPMAESAESKLWEIYQRYSK